jgi:hypothetical protein
MRGLLTFIVALLWGAFSAQFLVQVITSAILAGVTISGLAFSKVDKAGNVAGALTSLFHVILYASLFVAGNWITSEYVMSYDTWNVASITALVSFLGTVIYTVPQIPGKIRWAYKCAWKPFYLEYSMETQKGSQAAARVSTPPPS